HFHHGPGPFADGPETTPARGPGLDATGHSGLAGAAGQGHRTHTEVSLLVDAAHLFQALFRIEFHVLQPALDRAAPRLLFPDDRAGVADAALRQAPGSFALEQGRDGIGYPIRVR